MYHLSQHVLKFCPLCSVLQKFNGHDLHGRVLSVKLDAHIQ